MRVADSDANFVLFEVGGDQQIAWRRMLDNGVLVRDVGLPGWLRVTAGTPEETTAFLEALSLMTSLRSVGAAPQGAVAGAAGSRPGKSAQPRTGVPDNDGSSA